MRILILVVLFWINKLLFAQLPNEIEYFDSLKTEYSKLKSVTSVKLIHETYSDGTTKKLYFKANYVDDTTDCSWLIGPFYHYYKNGHLKSYLNVNTKTNVCDSMVTFYNNGKVWITDKYPKNPNEIINNSIAFNAKNIDWQFYLPYYYVQHTYRYRRDKINVEYISNYDLSDGKATIVSKVTKKYKIGEIEVTKKFVSGETHNSIEEIIPINSD